MSSWVGIPGRPPYVIPHGSAGLKKNIHIHTSFSMPYKQVKQESKKTGCLEKIGREYVLDIGGGGLTATLNIGISAFSNK